MSARRNLWLYVPYLLCSAEGVLHGVYLLWLTAHKGLPPVTIALLMAGGDLALLALEVPTGLFADRVGARRSLILGSLLQVVGLALLWLADGLAGLGLAFLLIAAGDAFRHGADEALYYRSCAALGLADGFGPRVARAHAFELVAEVALTAGGAWLVGRAGFDVAFVLEVGLALVGLALAFAMVDPAPAAGATEDDGDRQGQLAALRRGLPWARILPAAIAGTLAGASEFLVRSESGGRMSTVALGLVIAAAQLLEAAGAALVARGIIPIAPRALDRVVQVTLGGLVLAAALPSLLVPALLLVFLAGGIAPAIRSALLQREAPDEARATIASAAGAIDLFGTVSSLPVCAVAWEHAGRAGTIALFVALAVVGLAFARRPLISRRTC